MQNTWDKVGRRVVYQYYDTNIFQSFKEPVETHGIDLNS